MTGPWATQLGLRPQWGEGRAYIHTCTCTHSLFCLCTWASPMYWALDCPVLAQCSALLFHLPAWTRLKDSIIDTLSVLPSVPPYSNPGSIYLSSLLRDSRLLSAAGQNPGPLILVTDKGHFSEVCLVAPPAMLSRCHAKSLPFFSSP